MPTKEQQPDEGDVVREQDTYEFAKRQAIALLDQGFHLGGVIRASREEWHER